MVFLSSSWVWCHFMAWDPSHRLVYSQNYRVSPNCGCAYSSHLKADISYQDFICSKHSSSWLELQLLWMHALLWMESQLRLHSLSIVKNETYTLSGHLWKVFSCLYATALGFFGRKQRDNSFFSDDVQFLQVLPLSSCNLLLHSLLSI